MYHAGMRRAVLALSMVVACGGDSPSTGADAAGGPTDSAPPADDATVTDAPVVDALVVDAPAPDGPVTDIDGGGVSTGDSGVIVPGDGGVIFPADGGAGLWCVPAPPGCPVGPPCGASCCRTGEWCDTATATCHCGSGSACLAGDTCEPFGPVGPDECGSICCGVSGPCPG